MRCELSIEPGEIQRTPWTLSYVQRWLRRTKARRRGRDYARDVLATLVQMELLRDTDEVMTTDEAADEAAVVLWRVFEVVPVVRVLSSYQGA